MSIYKDIIAAIEAANSIVITSHKSPDGDSIGSSIGLKRIIEKMGKNVVVCHPDNAPAVYSFLSDTKEIISWEDHSEEVKQNVQNADLVFAVDYNDFGRLGFEMGEFLIPFGFKTILIDHHLNPADVMKLALSDTSCCSAAQLIFDILEYGKPDLIDVNICEPLYLGIMTDTGSFRFPSVEARTHEILGKMLALGLEHFKIHEAVFDSNTLSRLKLKGYATSEKLEIVHDGKIALISLSEDDLKRFNYVKGDTEGLVNLALSIEGVKAAVFAYEQDGKIKISFRGKGDFEVNQIANDHFNGGGHKYAAGGMALESLNGTMDKIKMLIPSYFK